MVNISKIGESWVEASPLMTPLDPDSCYWPPKSKGVDRIFPWWVGRVYFGFSMRQGCQKPNFCTFTWSKYKNCQARRVSRPPHPPCRRLCLQENFQEWRTFVMFPCWRENYAWAPTRGHLTPAPLTLHYFLF